MSTPPTERRCTLCKATKPIGQFVKATKRPDWHGYTYVCKPCQNDTNLRRKFGITREEYDRMFLAQGGLCALCRKPGGQRRLAVDHDHASGAIRGLLCNRCNLHLSALDDAAWMESARVYLALARSEN